MELSNLFPLLLYLSDIALNRLSIPITFSLTTLCPLQALDFSSKNIPRVLYIAFSRENEKFSYENFWEFSKEFLHEKLIISLE